MAEQYKFIKPRYRIFFFRVGFLMQVMVEGRPHDKVLALSGKAFYCLPYTFPISLN